MKDYHIIMFHNEEDGGYIGTYLSLGFVPLSDTLRKKLQPKS